MEGVVKTMPKITDDIRAASNGSKIDMSALLLEQSLNKLFYVSPDYELELRMLKKQKAQAQQSGDRYGLHLSAIIASDNEFCYKEQLLSLFYKQLQGSHIGINLKRIFREGESIGEKWQRLFVSGGMGSIDDMDITRFIEKYDLSYTPDAIIKVAGKRTIVEIKSMNTLQFKKATSHPSGRKQLRMYMFFEKCRNGFVLVEDKNTQEFKVFPEVYGETFTKDDIRPYIERLKQIQEYKNNFVKCKKVPKGICNSPTCKRALKCNMKDACWNIGIGRVKL